MNTQVFHQLPQQIKGKENSNFHPNTSRAYLYYSSRKVERSVVLLIRHTTKSPTQLQKLFLTVLTCDPLSLSLSLSLCWHFPFFFSFSVLSFSHCCCCFVFYNIKVKVLCDQTRQEREKDKFEISVGLSTLYSALVFTFFFGKVEKIL